MDDLLKSMLEAEQRAQRLVDGALQEQKKMLERAREEAEDAEKRSETRLHDLRFDLENKAEAEAARTISQLERRHKENLDHLNTAAERFREEACQAAIRIVADPDRL